MFDQLLETARFWCPATQARRYHAALATLLAMYRHPQLDDADKACIDAKLAHIYRSYGIYPWWRYRPNAHPLAMAADRAAAMYRLSIPTGIAQLGWDDILHPWHRQGMVLLHYDFRTYHADTDEAIEFLVVHGITSEDIGRFHTRWLTRWRDSPSETEHTPKYSE